MREDDGLMENFLSGPCPNDMQPGDMCRVVDDGPCKYGRRIRLEKVSKESKA